MMDGEFIKELRKIASPDVQIAEVGGRQIAITHGTTGIELKDLTERFDDTNCKTTTRITRLTDIQSFIAYVNRFKTDATIITMDDHEAVAQIDFIGSGNTPGTMHHVVSVLLKKTSEFEAFLGLHGKYVGQVRFADFVHDNRRYFTTPDGADLHDLIRDLRLTSKGNFRHDRDDQSGSTQLTYNVKVEAMSEARDEVILMPKQVAFAVVPYVGMEPVHFDADLRYRPPGDDDVGVQIGIRIDQLRERTEELLNLFRDQIASETEVPVYR